MIPSASSLHVLILASPVYWPEAAEAEAVFASIRRHLEGLTEAALEFHLLRPGDDLPSDRFRDGTAVLLPLSGGVQPLLVTLRERLRHGAVANAYLDGFLPDELPHRLMHRNAHPACTDFFAHCRLAGRPVAWLDSAEAFAAYARAHAATEALRRARILQIGATEPWVINSTRDPGRFRETLGCEVIPLEAEELYREFHAIAETNDEAQELSRDWWGAAHEHVGTVPADAAKASRVAVAMRRLLARHDADALAMACFAMIGDLDTTSCLALSALNDAAHTIGACEGDLDAAVTLYLLKQLGADFVWIANPIIHPGDFIDLAHCTAPRCACGEALPYRLLRHHESGRGIAPEVRLPGGRDVSLVRIGANLTELCVHPGRTESVAKQPTCHTQIRVHIPSTRRFLDSLNGTHVVMSYGDWRRELAHCADLLGLRLTGSGADDVAALSTNGPRPTARQSSSAAAGC